MQMFEIAFNLCGKMKGVKGGAIWSNIRYRFQS